MKTHTITFTERQITLIRVALLQRINRLKDKEDCKTSYDETLAMLNDGGPLCLSELNKADIIVLASSRKRKPQLLTTIGTEEAK